MKNSKGISLIALTITVFMIIVLGAIAIASIFATENTKRNIYVQKYEEIRKEIENKKTPAEEVQLAVVNAIGESGFEFEKIETILEERLNKSEMQDLIVDKDKKEVTVTYRGEKLKINEFGKVVKASE